MSTEHITAPLADEGNYAYSQSRGVHNCPNEGSNWELFDHKNDAVTARPQLHCSQELVSMLQLFLEKFEKKLSVNG